MRVVLPQLAYQGFDADPGLPRVEANLADLENRVGDATLTDTDVMVLPEFWVSSPAGNDEYAACALELGQDVDRLLGAFSKGHRLLFQANIVERARSGAIYDTSVLYGPEGDLLLAYREIAGGLIAASPVGDPMQESEGAPAGDIGSGLAQWLPTASGPYGSMASLVGSDLAYPELSVALTTAGVDILLHSAKEPAWTAERWQSVKDVRAYEAGICILSCNAADSTHTPTGEWGASRGRSRVILPSGETLVGSSTAGEELVVADVPDTGPDERSQRRLERRRSHAWTKACADMFVG